MIRRPKTIEKANATAHVQIVDALRYLSQSQVIRGRSARLSKTSWRTDYLQASHYALTQALQAVTYAIEFSQAQDESEELSK